MSMVQSKPSDAAAKGGKYLTFALGREEYGLEILKVREIIGYMDITAVPNTPPHIRGIINLRGRVISVLDLRRRFGMEAIPTTQETCIVVVETQTDERRVSMGIVVDRVSEVLDIGALEVENPPSFGTHVNTSFILGLAKVGSSVKILLNIDRVLTVEIASEAAVISPAQAA